MQNKNIFGQYFCLFPLMTLEARLHFSGITFLFIHFLFKDAFEVSVFRIVFASLQLHNGFMLLLGCWSILFSLNRSQEREHHGFSKLKL